MNGLRSFAIWLFLFGIAGTLCQRYDDTGIGSDPKLSNEVKTEESLEKLELLQQIDEEARGSRVARGLPNERKPFKHPSSDEMKHERAEARRQREKARRREDAKRAEEEQKAQEAALRAQIEGGHSVLIRMTTSDNLRKQREDMERGEKELAERKISAKKKRKN